MQAKKLKSIGIILIESEETRVVALNCRYSNGHRYFIFAIAVKNKSLNKM